jgi:hypothetical protein
MAERELKMSPDLMPQVIAGVKEITIRRGKRELEKHITIEGLPVTVESCEHYRLLDVPLLDLFEDGFETFGEALSSLRKFYPDLTPESDVTVVKFLLS